MRRDLLRRPGIGAIVFVFCVFCAPQVARAESVMAGAAKVELSLPPHTPLAGYSRRHGKPSTGTHDSIFVRAIVLRDAKTTAAIVSCEILMIDEDLAAAVQRALAARQLHVSPLLLAATHTHSGPGGYGRKFLEKLSMGHFDPEVFQVIVTTIVQAIEHASRNLQPVSMRVGELTTQGLVQNRMHEDGPVDHALSMFALLHEQHPIAVVVNFAAHPTTLGASNFQFSGDYPGVVSRLIEARWPGSVALFLAGAVGDQAPVKHGEGFERAEWLGRQLAEPAIEFLQHPAARPVEALAGTQQVMRLPPARVMRLPSWLGRLFVDDDATLTVMRLGQAVFLGAPCDLSAALGLRLKHAAREQGYTPLVVGFANEYIGYCLPANDYHAKSYERMMAFNGPDAGEHIVNQLTRMLTELVSHP